MSIELQNAFDKDIADETASAAELFESAPQAADKQSEPITAEPEIAEGNVCIDDFFGGKK